MPAILFSIRPDDGRPVYRQIVDQMVDFLDGKSDSVLADMRRDMDQARAITVSQAG